MFGQEDAGSAGSRRTAVTATVSAAVVNLALLPLGEAAGASFLVPQRGQDGAVVQIGPGAVLLSTVLPLAVGLVVTALVARRWARAAHLLRSLAIVVTVVSLAAPLATETDTSTRLMLAVMHLVVGGAYLAATRRQPRLASRQQVPATVNGCSR